jgi:putative FmdB family regulatory protein
MATYEYICLACEHQFEERRPMIDEPIATALACPSCGAERVRRRFSFSTTAGSTAAGRPEPGLASGGCCGGGACACGH